MKTLPLKKQCALALVVAGIWMAGPVMADNDKGGGKGGGKGGKHERMDRRDAPNDDRRGDNDRSRNDNDRARNDRDGRSDARRSHFENRQHVAVRDYYTHQYNGSRCPPGLAKKNNGCMPPGQARNWQVGRPLAREVVYYEVPQPLVLQIGPPPSGHRYVRVAGDILLLAVGTGMVVDAIQNLGRN
jgi:Ni/Co efflux regulator RcnB